MSLKPKLAVDIKVKGQTDPFSARPRRINLSFKPRTRLAKLLTHVPLYVGSAMFVLLLSSHAFAPNVAPGTHAQTTQITTDERAALEAQLKLYEEQIAGYEKTIKEYGQRGTSLKSEISILNTKINKINLQIKAVNLSISKLDKEIKDTSGKIDVVQTNIDSKKSTLTKALNNIYVSDRVDYIEILLQNPKLSDFFSNVNNLAVLQNNLRGVLEELVASHEELVEYENQLSLKRIDAAQLKSYQDAQKATVLSTKTEKDTLLKITKGKESEYQKYLVETRKKAAEIRSRIFQFLGGGELTFEKAYELAKLAEGASGVRAALILAILDRESALGQNVGQCDYRTAMHPTRDIPKFLNMINRLGLQNELNNGTLKVSCANSDGVYGGAMGPAQFIPSTWVMYESRIGQVTDNVPPSPWRNTDAIVGTALYIKDAMSACSAHSGLAKERCAAARYYAGSRWQTYLWGYGANVVNLAEKFQSDIDILNS